MCEPARSPCGGGRVAVGGGWAEVARELELANSQVPRSVARGSSSSETSHMSDTSDMSDILDMLDMTGSSMGKPYGN